MIALSSSAASSAAPILPAPGSGAQVASLVAASVHIKDVPANLVPALTSTTPDTPAKYFPATRVSCIGMNRCAYGKLDSRRVVLVLGDSHARMWLPALVPAAVHFGFRLVLQWLPACPTALVAVLEPATGHPYYECSKFRRLAIADVRRLSPELVLLTDRTANARDVLGHQIPNILWRIGEEQMISSLRSPRTHVAIIGDVTRFTLALPGCLGAYPTNIQRCSVPNPNPVFNSHSSAELSAAAALGVPYINPQPWLCRNVCSPIVGHFVAYYDAQHVSATYAAFLSNLLGSRVRQLIWR